MDQAEDKKPLVLRDERGRLLPGSRLAVGVKNPVAARISELKQAMLAAVTQQDVRDVMCRLLDLTRHEDGKIALAAIELFQARLFGKPREHVEMDITTDSAPTIPTVLDATDLAHLERMRKKLAAADPDVIDVDPQGGS